MIKATLIQYSVYAGRASLRQAFCSLNWHGTWYKPWVTTFYSWSMPEMSSKPNIRQWLNLGWSPKGRISQFSLSWSLPEVSSRPNIRQWLNLGQAERDKSEFQSKFDAIYTHKSSCDLGNPFSSGIPIGYCLLDRLVIGWFKCFQNLQVDLSTRSFTWSWSVVMRFCLCLVTRLVTLLTF